MTALQESLPLPASSIRESHFCGKSISSRRPLCASTYVNPEGDSISTLIPISRTYGWTIWLSPGWKQDPAEKDPSEARCDVGEEREKPGEQCVAQGNAQGRLWSVPSPTEKPSQGCPRLLTPIAPRRVSSTRPPGCTLLSQRLCESGTISSILQTVD